MDSSHFSGVVRITVRAFLTDEMILNLTSFPTILAVDIRHGIEKRRWHGLHANRRIKKREMVFHIFHGTHTKWTSITSATILSEACHVHHVPTFEATQWFSRLK